MHVRLRLLVRVHVRADASSSFFITKPHAPLCILTQTHADMRVYGLVVQTGGSNIRAMIEEFELTNIDIQVCIRLMERHDDDDLLPSFCVLCVFVCVCVGGWVWVWVWERACVRACVRTEMA